MHTLHTYVAVALGLFLLPGLTLAATLEGGERYSLSTQETVEDNLYVGAGDITVGGAVKGDLIVGGGTIVVSGDVRDDLAVAGGNVSVLAPTGGDARVLGGTILFDGPVGGDLMLAGGSVKTLSSVTVGKDLSIAGGYVVYNGSTSGDALIAGGDVVIDGVIEGDVVVRAGEALTLGEHARIGGTFVYYAPREDMLTQHERAVILGGTRFEETAPSGTPEDFSGTMAAALGALFLAYLVAVSLAAVLLVLVFKRFSQTVVTQASEGFWKHVVWGFILLVVVPVAFIILLVTLIGIHVGLLLLVSYILVLMVADLYAAIIFGHLVVKKVRKDEQLPLVWWHALLGVVLLGLISLIPIIGWIVGTVFFLLALGTLMQLFRTRVWANR